ncbi:hypothetical protein QNO07_03250 [Streptomyces sp. 549]|uniref:hypothetical protein n=1 Tax=Streptomyces sp. 549 TaxID=3049076 RepID=UPI0024C300AD|nr:hypothetical protein [Streptomyces sp. 549]MDK1472449.1 hypothetical protein [Streptomyces sp. 549]
MSDEERRAAVQRIQEAEQAVEELKSSLRSVGIVLPSLRVDPVSCARDEPKPLVDLGSCNLSTVRWLTCVLRDCARPSPSRIAPPAQR